MIEIGGQTQLSEWDMGAPQNMDHVRLMRSITKWAATIHEAKRIPEYISNAFRLAKSGTPGPVYLECPLNILAEKVEKSDVSFPEKMGSVARPALHPARPGWRKWITG